VEDLPMVIEDHLHVLQEGISEEQEVHQDVEVRIEEVLVLDQNLPIEEEREVIQVLDRDLQRKKVEEVFQDLPVEVEVNLIPVEVDQDPNRSKKINHSFIHFFEK